MTKDRSKTLVSVVIPTYERPEYLRGAIQTALGQTYDDIEVIVVNDGSEEAYAEEITSRYPDSVRCVHHDENRGLSAARNTGIEHASAEYIAFLNDDDRWHETKVARQVEKIDRDEQVGIVSCLAVSITPERELVHCESTALSGDCSEELLAGNTIETPSRVLVRRAALDDVGLFDESLPTKQDWDLYLRLCQNWTVASVDEHLCFRTIHESMSSSPTALERDKNAILEKHEGLMRERGVWDRARGNVAEEIRRAYLGPGKLKTAREHLKRALVCGRTRRRVALLALAYTHPAVVKRAIRLKRKVGLMGAPDRIEMIPREGIPALSGE